jgi:hypothetical protein
VNGSAIVAVLTVVVVCGVIGVCAVWLWLCVLSLPVLLGARDDKIYVI